MGKRGAKQTEESVKPEPDSKKKKVITAENQANVSQSIYSSTAGKKFTFKNHNFIHSSKYEATGKRHVWKNLKQILTTERNLNWKPTDITYASIEAPPSFLPAKKYSDISGLPAKYVDPHTKLRYSSADEFAQIRNLPSDIIAGLLQLRKASSLVG